MEYSLGDLADRFTINTRKKRLKPEGVTQKELDSLLEAMFKIVLLLKLELQKQFFSDLVQLTDINNAVWEKEFKIKEGKDNELDLAVIGGRALFVRDLNQERIAIKNRMNSYSATGFSEVKVGHTTET